MRVRLIIISMGLMLANITFAQDILYTKKSAEVNEESLTAAQKQQYFDIKEKFNAEKKAFVENVILEDHIMQQVKKTGKTRTQVEEKIFSTAKPSDSEAKKWFTENSDKVPPGTTFDKVKENIKSYMMQKKLISERTNILKKLLKEEQIIVSIKKNIAPTINIVTTNAPVKGSKNSKIKFVEFADYQCPHCKEANKIMQKLLKKHGKKFSLTFMDFPINRSGISLVIAHGAFCAKKQAKFWQYHNLAFAEQDKLTKKWPISAAKDLKLKMSDFKTCLKSKEAKTTVAGFSKEAERVGVRGTPTIYLNGKIFKAHTFEEMEKVILSQ